MRRNTEVKIKVLECSAETHLVVLQTPQRTYSIQDKQLYDFITSAVPVKPVNKPASEKENLLEKEAMKILSWVNEICQKKFELTDKDGKPKSTNLSPIIARLKEGEPAELFRQVIIIKALEWGSDPAMKKFLRPSTLFSGKNFANYKQEVLDAHKNPNAFKNHVRNQQQEQRFKNQGGFDPLDSMPD